MGVDSNALERRSLCSRYFMSARADARPRADHWFIIDPRILLREDAGGHGATRKDTGQARAGRAGEAAPSFARTPLDRKLEELEEALRSCISVADERFRLIIAEADPLAELLNELLLGFMLLAVDVGEEHGVLEEHAAVVRR